MAGEVGADLRVSAHLFFWYIQLKFACQRAATCPVQECWSGRAARCCRVEQRGTARP
jgi:hypothetical protein